jgi:hypothetical protein
MGAMEKDSVNSKRKGRYISTIVIVVIAILILYLIDITYESYCESTRGSILFTHFERIAIKSASVSKSRHTYFIYINFVNTGSTYACIDYVSLNGVPCDDPGWAGTIRPTIFGNLTSGTFLKSESSDPLGIIDFSDDCVYDPNGVRLTAGVMVKITIHTTGGKDYDSSVTLP